ncbi:MAG TPA: toll/interleukin-1 receptor domain-containing protein [Ktedonobacterales bacterium]|nr:toll/interleukin-1 receptor domain-containing protein [Ktedonobacterales bacterium]
MFGNGKVFVSHTHEDNQLCEPLLAALDAWQLDYWFDVAQLSAGQEFPEHIQQAIRERDILLRICTPAANRSVWLEREAAMARVLRSARPRNRMVVNLVLAPGYDTTGDAHDDLVIDATRQTEAEWLRALRITLGIPSRARQVSRRAVIGLGVTSLVALSATAYAGKLLFAPDVAQAHSVPTVHNPTPTPQSGVAHLRWVYRSGYDAFQTTSLAVSGASVYALIGNSGLPEVLSLTAQDGTLRWQHEYGFTGYAAPTISGDILYAIGYDFKAGATYLFAFATSDGSERWRTPLETDATNTSAADYVSSVTTAGNLVLVRYKNVVVAADRATGTIQWWQGLPIDDSTNAFYHGVAAPIYASNTVYACGVDGGVRALRSSTGAEIWSTPVTNKRITATPALAGGVLYFGADDGYAYALDATSGALRWRQPMTLDQNLSFVASQPIVASSVVYIGGGSLTGVTTGTVTGDATDLGDAFFALDSATGRVVWRINPSRQRYNADSTYLRKGIQCTPVLSGDGSTIYVTGGISTNSGLYREALYALSTTDGSVRWSYEVPGGDEYPSSPVAQDGMLFWASSEGAIYAMAM